MVDLCPDTIAKIRERWAMVDAGTPGIDTRAAAPTDVATLLAALAAEKLRADGLDEEVSDLALQLREERDRVFGVTARLAETRRERDAAIAARAESEAALAAEKLRADGAETMLRDLEKRFDAAKVERDEAERKRGFSEQWYAERFERLAQMAREDMTEPLRRRYFEIVANGNAHTGLDGAHVCEPPTYAQQMEMAKWRAKEAEKQRAAAIARAERAEAELAQLRIDYEAAKAFGDVRHAQLAESDAALSLLREQWDAMVRERDGALAWSQRTDEVSLEVMRERDEARAEIERLTVDRDKAVIRARLAKDHWRTLRAAAERVVELWGVRNHVSADQAMDALRAALAGPERVHYAEIEGAEHE